MYNPINIISMKPTTTLIGAYTRIACIAVSLWLACTATVSSQQLPASEPETPLLTLACISDIHTERSLITDINNISLRKSFTQTLNRIRAEEKIDVMVLGGDCTSDATIPIENWEKVRSLIARYSRIAFPSRDNTPVLYVTGNHDYEVANWYDLPKDYNAADYYTFPMKDDIGELTADEAFYEQAENAGKPKMTMLAAYHYVIHGFDFVILNCGKYQFANAGHYEYSVESVQWVADWAEGPNKCSSLSPLQGNRAAQKSRPCGRFHSNGSDNCVYLFIDFLFFGVLLSFLQQRTALLKNGDDIVKLIGTEHLDAGLAEVGDTFEDGTGGKMAAGM